MAPQRIPHPVAAALADLQATLELEAVGVGLHAGHLVAELLELLAGMLDHPDAGLLVQMSRFHFFPSPTNSFSIV